MELPPAFGPLLAVAKIPVAVLLLIAADLGAHPDSFGAGGAKPPDWRMEHYLLIVSAFAVAYPQSIIPTHRLISLAVMLISAIPLLESVGSCNPAKDPLYPVLFIISAVPMIMTVAESLFRRTRPPKTKEKEGT